MSEKKTLKQQVIEAYGGAVCACCGVTEESFLQIDHVNNDGALHRKTIPGTSGQKVYRWLKRNNYPPGFQVLCANCNVSKSLLGKCVHNDRV